MDPVYNSLFSGHVPDFLGASILMYLGGFSLVAVSIMAWLDIRRR